MSNLDRFRILLVEDFDDARELYSTCLRSSGYEVIEAATGIDIAAKIVEFIEEKHRPGQTRTRGRG